MVIGAVEKQTRLSVTLYVIACLVIVVWSSRRMQGWWHLHYKDIRLILCREVIGVYLKNCTEHING
jgi:hypothetical protein